MPDPFPILMMLAPAGPSRAERWIAQAQRAAAMDLIERLQSLAMPLQLHMLAADREDQEAFNRLGVKTESSGPRFHFGEALTRFAQEHGYERIAYFGGASAPLLSRQALEDAISLVRAAQSPMAVVNNLHSTDWAIYNGAHALHAFAVRFPTDNPLGWVLQQEAGYQVRALPAGAGSRVDIDTPADLLVLSAHSGVGPHLAHFLAQLPANEREKVQAVGRVLTTPGSTLSLIGRGSSAVWRELEQRTQIWIRVFVEERGMLASGRQARGEVHSLLAALLQTWGPTRFVAELEQVADAVLWDTRVWMAHCGLWPSDAERFAADLGWYEQIETPGLRALTEAFGRAHVPFLVGGHGVVAGNIYALLEAFDL